MRRALALVLALPLSLVAAPALGQATGTSLSGPTSADSASAFYNPAAMAAGRGTHIELDIGLAVTDLSYETADGSGASSQQPIGPIVTLGGFTDAAHPEWRIGLTASISRTAGGAWDRDDGAGGVTRYYLADGASFHIQAVPAVSWTPAAIQIDGRPWITFGLGANLAYGSISSDLDKDFGAQLNQTAGSMSIDSPFPYADPRLAAPVAVSGDGFGVGAIFGVLFDPIEQLRFGASIHSPVLVAGGGSLDVSYPEELRQFVRDTLPSAELPELSGDFDVALDIPMILTAGVTGRPHPAVELSAYYYFEHTSSQPNFNLDIYEATSDAITSQSKPQAYVDRHRVFFRASFFPVPELMLGVHGFFQSNTVPEETTTPTNLDFHRVEVGAAARWQIVREFSVMVQYSHIFLVDRDISTSLHRPVTQPSLAAFNHPSPTGRYSGGSNTVRLALALHL